MSGYWVTGHPDAKRVLRAESTLGEGCPNCPEPGVWRYMCTVHSVEFDNLKAGQRTLDLGGEA